MCVQCHHGNCILTAHQLRSLLRYAFRLPHSVSLFSFVKNFFSFIFETMCLLPCIDKKFFLCFGFVILSHFRRLEFHWVRMKTPTSKVVTGFDVNVVVSSCFIGMLTSVFGLQNAQLMNYRLRKVFNFAWAGHVWHTSTSMCRLRTRRRPCKICAPAIL